MGAEVLAGVPRLLRLFPEAPGERLPYDRGLETFLASLSPHLGARKAVVLVTGDPGLASLAASLARRHPFLPSRRLPGISSVQLACAEAGIDWLDAWMLRAHGSLPRWDEAWEKHQGPFVLLAGAEGAAGFAAEMASRLGRRAVWRCERLGLEGQQVSRLAPADLAAEGCDPLSILIVDGAMS